MRTGRMKSWSSSPGFLDPSAGASGEPLDRPVMYVVIEGRASVGGTEIGVGEYAICEAGEPFTFRAVTPLKYLEFEFEAHPL